MKRKRPIDQSNDFMELFVWNFFMLLFFEVLLRLLNNELSLQALLQHFLNVIFFSLAATLFLLSFISLFPKRYHYIISFVWMCFLFVFFASQIVYYQIFQTYYYFHSVTHLKQGLGFYQVILSIVSEHVWWILISLGLIGFYLYRSIRNKKRDTFNKDPWKKRIIFCNIFLLNSLIFHFIGVWNVKMDARTEDVYYHTRSIQLAVDRLGLITAARIEFIRTLTNWTPELELANETNEHTDIEKDDKTYTTFAPINDDDERDEKETFNELNIPFDTLKEETDDEEIKRMHQYFKEKEPTNKNEFTGKFSNYNLIWITAEAYAPYAVDQELTPTLYHLSKESIQFTDFYNPLWDVSTSDGEYTILQSLVPKAGVWSFSESGQNELPFTIANLLQDEGYETRAYHNHTYDYYDRHITHPNIGYDYKGAGNGLSITKQWPSSDLEMIEATVDEYIDKEPFHTYYMTVSGHLEYNFIGNDMAMKNKHYVADLDLSDEAKAYLAAHIELDRALEHLLSRLEEKDVLDHTLIVMTGDHYPYGLSHDAIEELAGTDVDETFDLYKNEWIIYTPELEEDIVVDEPTYTLDMLPTILNLMELDFDSRLFMGRDVFSDAPPLVVFNDKSFLTEKIKYDYPNDELILRTDEEIDDTYVSHFKKRTEEIFYYSTKILEKDYYATLKWNSS